MSESGVRVTCNFSVEKSRNGSWSANHLFLAKWQDESRILVHPETHYWCEVYEGKSSGRLLGNATTAAATRRGNQRSSASFRM